MRDTDGLLKELVEAMAKEGVIMSDIGPIEARVVTLLNRARNERKAESMLPLVGAEIAAERLGVCPRTVYNLAIRSRKKKLQENRQACA